jgi:hypothetical protein
MKDQDRLGARRGWMVAFGVRRIVGASGRSRLCGLGRPGVRGAGDRRRASTAPTIVGFRICRYGRDGRSSMRESDGSDV